MQLTSSSPANFASRINHWVISCLVYVGNEVFWLCWMERMTSPITSNFRQLIRSLFAPTKVLLPSSADTRSRRWRGRNGILSLKEFPHASRYAK